MARFARFLARHRAHLGEVFTTGELAAAARGAGDLYLASRWALKEAVLKALGTGWGSGVQWTDVEAVGGFRAPEIHLHGAAARVAKEKGCTALLGSTGWSRGCVIAMAVLGAPSADG